MNDFFNQTEIEVTVSYPSLPAPMRFFLRPVLAKEEKLARQRFFGLTDTEREDGSQVQNAELINALSVRAPENVPGFDAETGNLKEFFSAANPIKAKVLEDVVTLYFQKIQPAEFFRGV